MNIVITGANGQLGRCLQDKLAQRSGATYTALTSSQLDITDRRAVQALLAKLDPDVVINAAAYTAVDAAEDEPDLARSVNAEGVSHLAEACAQRSIPMIHVSTDYVFDGEASQAYLPDSETNPTGVYGLSKLEGEQMGQEMLPEIVIVRTAWVYSEYGANFLKTMLRLSESRDEVGVVDDQIGCPTYAGNIAEALLAIADQVEAGSEHWGVYHYVDDTEMSWHAFAEQVFAKAKAHQLIEKSMTVNAISTSEFPTKTKRPPYSVLSTASLQRDFGVTQGVLTDALDTVMTQLNKGPASN